MLVRTASDVGALIRDVRRRRGLTQGQLAAQAGVTRRWLSALESGKTGVELGLVLATFDALGINLRADAADQLPVGMTDSDFRGNRRAGGTAPLASTRSIDLDKVLASLDEDDT